MSNRMTSFEKSTNSRGQEVWICSKCEHNWYKGNPYILVWKYCPYCGEEISTQDYDER
ncbi:MAG: hypothetical protein FWC20_00610 [Oscillospiraceae bacterium]|nr:hypothetical protein [Oscillospiraceae bacterium]MCL2277894.1 hypothetical protein [Oscillospiraceae bacterium]